jgi:hypothetical protein
MLLLVSLYAIYFIVLTWMAYEDYRYTIVRDELVFEFLLISGIPLALIESCIVCIIAWIIYVALLYWSYEQLKDRELLFPYVCLVSSLAFSLLDILLGKAFFVLASSSLAFAVLLYYLKAWALGDIFAFLGVSMALAPLALQFSSVIIQSRIANFLHFLLSTLPLQLQVLLLVVLGYIPYVAILGILSKLRNKTQGFLELSLEYLEILLIYLIFEILDARKLGFLEASTLIILVSLTLQYLQKKLIKSARVNKIFLILLILSDTALPIIAHMKIPKLLIALLSSTIILLLNEFFESLTLLSGKRYVSISELADGDIPGFSLIKLPDGRYLYLEGSVGKSVPGLEDVEVLIRVKNPNGLYPEQISLLQELRKRGIVPEYVPIYKGLPMLPAFLLGSFIAVFIFLFYLL